MIGVGDNIPVRNLGSAARACSVGAVIALSVLVSGCTDVVSGSAVRDADAVPLDVPPLAESQLEDVLLTVDELNSIVGSSTMEVVSESDELADNSLIVSDPDCLGAVYGAEEQVYGSAWSAVRDQIIREPGDEKEHWAQQTVAVYPSARAAQKFLADSTSDWEQCGGFSVTVDDGQSTYIWQLEAADSTDDIITQVVIQEDSDGWECQHALSAVSNVTIETWACAVGVDDEAVEMARRLVSHVAEQ